MTTDPERRGPIDPDVSGPDFSQHRWTLPVIALGGLAGAAARHGLELAWPTSTGAFPWATLVTNVAGCALLGLLMAYVVDRGAGHPLLRPFAGTGVLGGFTTFSTYATQTTGLLDAHPARALAYLVGTALLALAAVALGAGVGRAMITERAR